jgi:hypothetical protein
LLRRDAPFDLCALDELSETIDEQMHDRRFDRWQGRSERADHEQPAAVDERPPEALGAPRDGSR